MLDQDPAGPRAQELAGRWLELLGAFAPKGPVDPQMLKYSAAFMSEGDWPAGASRPEPPFKKPVWEFIAKAIAVRRSISASCPPASFGPPETERVSVQFG